MQWLYLFIAGLFEVTWAVAMKFSHGFSETVPSLVTVVGMALSFLFLSLALRHLSLGVAYAVWTGIGIVGTFLVGIYALNEPVTLPQGVCVAMIVMGIVGLRLLSS